MITVSYAEFFNAFLIIMFLYIAWLWLREHNRQKRNEWQLSNRQLFHCNTCHLSFVPKQTVSLCRCPRCNTVCIRRTNGVSPSLEKRAEK